MSDGGFWLQVDGLLAYRTFDWVRSLSESLENGPAEDEEQS